MADAAPVGNSSTPSAAAVTPPAPAPATAPTTPPATPAAPVPPAPGSTPSPASPATPATDSPASTTAAPASTAPPAEPTTAAPVPPAFTLPTDLKLAPEAVSKFEAFLKAKAPVDGKFTMTAQELIDEYATQARTAYQRWQAQLAEQDTTWAAASKARFTAPQLAAAETAIGFLTSFEPEFRELAQSFRNHPSFVNAMRVVGERLSEDTFEIAGAPPPRVTQKSAAERMGYVKPKSN